VPGFVEAGIYAKLKEKSGISRARTAGHVGAGIGFQRRRPGNRARPAGGDHQSVPVRPLLAFTTLVPSLGEWALGKTGGHDFFRRVVESQKHKKN
jgi:hypothetical protein